MSKEILEIILNEIPFPVYPEYKFSSKRKFRFDYFISLENNKGLAIEYEGISFDSQQSGHQNWKGFISNCDKYNLAVSMGIPVLRYTVKHLAEPDQVKNEILLTLSKMQIL